MERRVPIDGPANWDWVREGETAAESVRLCVVPPVENTIALAWRGQRMCTTYDVPFAGPVRRYLAALLAAFGEDTTHDAPPAEASHRDCYISCTVVLAAALVSALIHPLAVLCVLHQYYSSYN